ncbi:hypothetical protein DRF57_12410, partial [Chryseobacterium rhizosphaerae]
MENNSNNNMHKKPLRRNSERFLFYLVSSPEISIHKKSIVMEEHLETQYVKRTQRDYNLSLKLQIVKEIEAGKSGI